VRLLVTGGRTGYLGRHVVTAAAGHDVVAVGSVDADLRDRRAVDALVADHHPPTRSRRYGAAKAAAETCALAVCPDVVVARTSLILGDGTSQHERLVHYLLAGAEGALLEDERRCPVHVTDLADALVEVAGSGLQGVPNVAGTDAMSRFELGRLIARRDGLDPSSLRSTSRVAARVPGPVDVRLDSTKASQVLETRLRGAGEFL
jgi:dTDP-4-dehydrorhamnose reductase